MSISRGWLDRVIVEDAKQKFEKHLEAYKIAFILQYGNSIKLTIEKKKDRYFDYWMIGIKSDNINRIIAKIETNIRDNIFDIYINVSTVSIDYEDLYKFKYRVLEIKNILGHSPVIEISTDNPLFLIEILTLCEKHIEYLTSA